MLQKIQEIVSRAYYFKLMSFESANINNELKNIYNIFKNKKFLTYQSFVLKKKNTIINNKL